MSWKTCWHEVGWNRIVLDRSRLGLTRVLFGSAFKVIGVCVKVKTSCNCGTQNQPIHPSAWKFKKSIARCLLLDPRSRLKNNIGMYNPLYIHIIYILCILYICDYIHVLYILIYSYMMISLRIHGCNACTLICTNAAFSEWMLRGHTSASRIYKFCRSHHSAHRGSFWNDFRAQTRHMSST